MFLSFEHYQAGTCPPDTIFNLNGMVSLTFKGNHHKKGLSEVPNN